MGMRPKCLLERDGVPIIRHLILHLAAYGMDDLVVVLGHHAQRVEPAIRDLPGKRVHNPTPDDGQISSMRLGLQALAPACQTILVALADQPMITARDIGDLLDAYAKRPAGTELLQPRVDGLPGNPVVFSAAVRAAILGSDASTGGRQWQAAHPDKVYRWGSDNRNYRTDVDTAADLVTLAARTGCQLRWPADLERPA